MTSSKAQMMALTDRDATITSNAKGRTNATLGDVLRAARNASGRARMIAIAVPSVAMFSVSHSGRQSSWI